VARAKQWTVPKDLIPGNYSIVVVANDSLGLWASASFSFGVTSKLGPSLYFERALLEAVRSRPVVFTPVVTIPAAQCGNWTGTTAKSSGTYEWQCSDVNLPATTRQDLAILVVPAYVLPIGDTRCSLRTTWNGVSVSAFQIVRVIPQVLIAQLNNGENCTLRMSLHDPTRC